MLVGVWMPKRWELSIAALQQYTTPLIPKESTFIDRPKAALKVLPSQTTEPPVSSSPRRRPPSRRIMRHLLRARVEAIRALASFFAQLEKDNDKRVKASSHLARVYGGEIHHAEVQESWEEVQPEFQPTGWRNAREVVGFLRKHGAKIPSLGHDIEGEWAALASDAEGDASSTSDDHDDMVGLRSLPQ